MNILDLLVQTILGKIATTFLISMVPVIELRGGVPYGIALGLPYPLALTAAMVDMKLKKAMPTIFLGVLIAAGIMTAVTFGAIHIF